MAVAKNIKNAVVQTTNFLGEIKLKNIKDIKRVIVKVGTSTITHSTGLIDIRRMERLVKVLSDIKNSGREVALVSSGAIGVGVGKLKLSQKPKDIPSKQAAAAIGQCELMYIYDKLFSEYNHTVAQILMTRDVIERPKGKTNVINTFNRLFEMGAIPVINENDTVATEEIEFGDNDSLSAVVAEITSADMLIIMSDIDGLYDKNPAQFADAKLIPDVYEITDEIKALAGDSGSNLGTGGMVTKLHAAEIAFKNDIPMYIVNGENPNILYDIFDGKKVGTLFAKR